MEDGTMEDGTMEDETMEDGTMEDGTMEDGTMEDGDVATDGRRCGAWLRRLAATNDSLSRDGTPMFSSWILTLCQSELEGGDGEVDLRDGGAEREHEDDGVEDGAGEQAVGAGGEADGFADTRIGREFFTAGLAQFDAGDEAALADFVDERLARFQASESAGEVRDFSGKVAERVFGFEQVEAGESGGAAERIRGVTVAVVECVIRAAEEGVINFPGGQGDGEWQVAAGEAFREAEEVRDHIFLLTGEHASGAAEAGHHLVENEVDTGGIAPGAEVPQHPGGPRTHLVDALDEWLDDDGGDFFLRQSAEFVHGRDVADWESAATEALEKAPDATERGRAQGVAVVAVGEGDKGVALRIASLEAVLDLHFQRALDGGRAVVRKEHALQRVFGKKRTEPSGELGGQRVGEAEERRVGDGFELAANRCVDRRVGVPVDVGPDRRIAIEVFSALGIPQPTTFAADENERFVVRGAPFARAAALTGEWVPAMGLVAVDPTAGVVAHGGRVWTRAGGINPQSTHPIARSSLDFQSYVIT